VRWALAHGVINGHVFGRAAKVLLELAKRGGISITLR